MNYGAEVFALFNYFVCQADAGICVKDNKRSMLSCSNYWKYTLVWIASPKVPSVREVESGKYTGNMVDPERSSNEAQNLSPRFLISSHVQEPAINKAFPTTNHHNVIIQPHNLW